VRGGTHILFALDGIHEGWTQGRILIFCFIYPSVSSNVESDISWIDVLIGKVIYKLDTSIAMFA
jgi:hypothetical protein